MEEGYWLKNGLDDELSNVTTVDPRMSTDNTVIRRADDYVTIMTRSTREREDGR